MRSTATVRQALVTAARPAALAVIAVALAVVGSLSVDIDSAHARPGRDRRENASGYGHGRRTRQQRSVARRVQARSGRRPGNDALHRDPAAQALVAMGRLALHCGTANPHA